MMDTVHAKLVRTALFSRFLVIGLSAVANFIIPDHDAKVFKWLQVPATATNQSLTDTPTIGDNLISYLCDGLLNWDGQYFMHIASTGYTYENTLAFMPLYPVLVRHVGEVVYWLLFDYQLINFVPALKLAAVMINIACFVAATLSLFELSRRVLGDDRLAYRSALLFCINPASIFFSAAYSESMNAALTFYGLYKLEKNGFTLRMEASFAASTLCRANSCLNIGFVAYKGARLVSREWAIFRRLKQLGRADISDSITNVIAECIVPTFVCILVCLMPFILFQWFAFVRFCGLTKQDRDFHEAIVKYAIDNNLKLPTSDPSPWCSYFLPMPYSYVQSHYWNVGFLRYYEVKQLPNFILAVPMLLIIWRQSIRFYRQHSHYCRRLGLTYFAMNPAEVIPRFDMYATKVLPRECFVYIVHAVLLSVFVATCAHVQASYLFILSSCVMFGQNFLFDYPTDHHPFACIQQSTRLLGSSSDYSSDPAASYSQGYPESTSGCQTRQGSQSR